MKEIITYDDIRNMAVIAVGRLTDLGYVKDCTDTDDEDQFEVGDTIAEVITEELERLGFTKLGEEDQ